MYDIYTVKKTQLRARTFQPIKKLESENLDDGLPRVGDANFKPYVINVHKGEDISGKIMSFCQQESGVVSVLSAAGFVSTVTLDCPKYPGGMEKYEGYFEILSLTGSFMPVDNGVLSNKAGGMSVSLTTPERHFLGGRVDGLLIAASFVQVVLVTFMSCHHEKNKAEDMVESVNSSIDLNKLPSEGNSGDNDSVNGPYNMELSD